MKTFNDLEFKSNPMGTLQARMKFDGGYELSVVAGEFAYSTPRKSNDDPDYFEAFEIAVFKDGEFTRELFLDDHDDDVMGYVSRAQINTFMWQLQTGR